MAVPSEIYSDGKSHIGNDLGRFPDGILQHHESGLHVRLEARDHGGDRIQRGQGSFGGREVLDRQLEAPQSEGGSRSLRCQPGQGAVDDAVESLGDEITESVRGILVNTAGDVMLFGDVPSFDIIMEGLRRLEATVNSMQAGDQ